MYLHACWYDYKEFLWVILWTKCISTINLKFHILVFLGLCIINMHRAMYTDRVNIELGSERHGAVTSSTSCYTMTSIVRNRSTYTHTNWIFDKNDLQVNCTHSQSSYDKQTEKMYLYNNHFISIYIAVRN